MARLSGKKPLEKKAIKKKALQTKNVKKLMTSDDAYSPEKRMIKMTTDFSNIKDETKKAREKFTDIVGAPTSVQVLNPKDFPKPRIARKGGGRAYGKNS